MNHTQIPAGYKSAIGRYDTQLAIGCIKRNFEEKLSRALNLQRVSAPLFLDTTTGFGATNLTRLPVAFTLTATGETCQVVRSLSKWERMALYQYDFPVFEGIWADMNAVRPDVQPDNLHSAYVDQWDWEMAIDRKSRNLDYLKSTVKRVVGAICDTQEVLVALFPTLGGRLRREVSFITAAELAARWPDATVTEREDLFVRSHKTTFVLQVGKQLENGEVPISRPPDVDDWELSGQLLFWSDVMGRAVRLSMMGLRVDSRALDTQLSAAGRDELRQLPYHKMLLDGTLPLTIGGSIGESRLAMLILGKAHIGEVQASVWDEATLAACRQAGVQLL